MVRQNGEKLGPDVLRKTEPSPEELKKIKRNPIYFVLDEILDTFNIGSMFRLADAVAAEKIFLCGQMESPPSSRIHKAAVGTENWVPWEKRDSTLTVIQELKKKKIFVVAVEQAPQAIPFWDLKPKFPIALVLGHETRGVGKKILAEVDTIVELPMVGINRSFNVWGSAAVVAYQILKNLWLLSRTC